MNNALNKWIRCPLTWACLAFILYVTFFFCRAPWLYPGQSAFLLKDVLLPETSTTPIIAPLTEGVLHLLHAVLPADLFIVCANGMSMLFAALNVFLVGWILTLIIKIFFEHSPSKDYVQTMITWAIPVASLLFLTTPEVLRAATHFQHQMIQLTFILLMAGCTLRAIQAEKARPFLLSSALLGLTLFESKEALLLTMPLIIFSLVSYYFNVGRLSAKKLFKFFILPFGGALLLFLGLAHLLSIHPKEILIARYSELALVLKTTSIFLIFALAVFPLVLALASLRRISSNIRSLQILVIYLTLATFAIATILPTTCNPIHLLGFFSKNEKIEIYPLALITCMVLSVGLLMALTTAFRVIRRPAEGGEDNGRQRHFLRLLARPLSFLLPATVIVLASLSTISTFAMDRAHKDLTRTVLDQKIDILKKSHAWVLDDSPLAQWVALRCHATGIDSIAFLSPMELQQPITPDAPLYKILTESTLIKRHLTEAQKKDLQPYAAISGFHYLKMLIAECPEVLSSIHTLTPSATVWYDLDLVPLYTGTTFVGLPATQLDQHTLQVPAVQHVVDHDYLGYPQDIGFLNFIQQTSRDACQFHLDTAARLAQEPSSKCKQLAIEHLHAAWALNPEEVQTTRDDILSYLKDNVLMLQGIAIASALELKSDNIQAGSPIILDDANAPHHLNWLTLIPSYKHYIKTRERAPGSRTMPGIHLNRYQNLAQYDKPRLSETEEKTLREILILEQQAFQHMRDTTNLEAARKIIDQLELKLQSINLPTDDVAYLRALYWNLKGDATQSLAHVETFLARHPENLEALTLFATIQLESNKLEEVKNKTLPRIRAVTGTDKNYHYLIIKAQFEERRNNLQEARTCFLQAIEARPNEPHTKVKETVLILDMRLGDKTAAKHHASNFLKQNINFTFAHYILGSMALEEGNLEDARVYLEHASIKSNTPTALAYNDLAELHRRQKNYRHAYEYAKTAYQQLPGLIIAHETAAAALIELGDYVRAEAELNTAIAKTKNAPLDARIRLTRAILLSKTNRLEEARQELKKIHPTTLDKTSQKEYERLLQTL